MELDVRVAISQQPMHWHVEDNLLEIEAALETASAHGAHLVLFPEMTLIGLHTKIRDLLDRVKLTEALGSVAAACRTHPTGWPAAMKRRKPLKSYVLQRLIWRK